MKNIKNATLKKNVKIKTLTLEKMPRHSQKREKGALKSLPIYPVLEKNRDDRE